MTARALPLAALACALAVAAGTPPLFDVPDGPPPCSSGGAGALVSGGRFVLQASYDLASASGTLRRHEAAGDGFADIASWDAAQLLGAQAERNIHTLAYDSAGRSTTVDFIWDMLPEASRALLDAGDGLGEARVNFLRGDRSRELGQEGGVFRTRASVMGDVVNSVPLLVGAPSVSVQGPGYARFHADARSRPPTVYVGANDGMLHAFAASDGAEVFAYVPNALHAALPELSKPGYTHRAWVDGSAGHGEAIIGGQWRTVLASGMGMGARGVFALDVTNPSAFASGLGALWEFTERDDPAMGHVRGAPLIAKFSVGTAASPAFRYFAVVASGINNEGPAALFLLALDKPASEAWRHKKNYYRLSTPDPEVGSANALSPPVLALAADGSVRYAYAGDLQGNLWRFDFTRKPPWKYAGPGPGNTPLFVARDAAGRRQPIAHAPRVVFAAGSGYLVLFGTGKLIDAADTDPAGYTPQTFYAVRDSTENPPAVVSGRAALGPRSEKGWYIDLPHSVTQGERSAGPPALVSGTAVLDTVSPGDAACSAAVVRSYVVDVLSGLEKSPGSATGVAPTGTVVQRGGAIAPPMLVSAGPVVGERTPTGGAASTHTVSLVRPGPAGAGPSVQQVTASAPAKRVSWREVANWQELHEAARRKSERK
jgi:type IV pilus assembly protein PilY1